MLKFDAPMIPATPATRALAPAQPMSVSHGAGQTGFSAVMSGLQDEIHAFIEKGASTSSGLGLNISGQVLQQRLQHQVALGEAEPNGRPTMTAAQQTFLSNITPWAQSTAAQLGVAPHLVAAHAALESGWGQKPLRQDDGSHTHNLFSIKATKQWQGEHADVLTTEYENGTRLRQVERFKSYPDYASAFQDYAKLLTQNPRYQNALNTGLDARAFAQGLSQGGYATDPQYVQKFTQVAHRIRHAMQANPVGED